MQDFKYMALAPGERTLLEYVSGQSTLVAREDHGKWHRLSHLGLVRIENDWDAPEGYLTANITSYGVDYLMYLRNQEAGEKVRKQEFNLTTVLAGVGAVTGIVSLIMQIH